MTYEDVIWTESLFAHRRMYKAYFRLMDDWCKLYLKNIRLQNRVRRAGTDDWNESDLDIVLRWVHYNQIVGDTFKVNLDILHGWHLWFTRMDEICT